LDKIVFSLVALLVTGVHAAAGLPRQEVESSVQTFSFPGSWEEHETAELTLFYPGQVSWEWLSSDAHPGSAGLLAGTACSECHTGQVAPHPAELGERLVGHPTFDPEPIGDKRPSIDLSVQAAYDDDNLYLRFSWASAEPGVYQDYFRFDGEAWERYGGERPGTPEDQLAQEDRLSVMIGTENVRAFDGADFGFETIGCFAACHSSLTDMPDAPSSEAVEAHPYLGEGGLGEDRVRKYLLSTRSELDDAGGWANVKPAAELDALKADGAFLDLWQWRAHRSNTHGWGDDGYVFEYRFGDDGRGPYSSLSEPEYMFNHEVYGSNAPKWDELKNAGTPYFINEDDADSWLPFDPELDWEAGDTLPRRILRTPEGSRADVMAQGHYADGRWVVELARPLTPSDAAEDQPFEAGGVYSIAVSIHDDHVSGYRHHVSFPVRLGLEADDALEADIIARRVE
jgi:hypothetical protein